MSILYFLFNSFCILFKPVWKVLTHKWKVQDLKPLLIWTPDDAQKNFRLFLESATLNIDFTILVLSASFNSPFNFVLLWQTFFTGQDYYMDTSVESMFDRPKSCSLPFSFAPFHMPFPHIWTLELFVPFPWFVCTRL